MFVSNSGPLIWLSHVDRFGLLRDLFGAVAISPEVYAETVTRASGYPNAASVSAACEAGWMVVVPPGDGDTVTALTGSLHLAEAETLVLARERNATAVLVDDLHARAFAKTMGLKVIGTAGILLLARQRGMAVDVRGLLDAMRTKGFRLGDDVYADVLRRAAELGPPTGPLDSR